MKNFLKDIAKDILKDAKEVVKIQPSKAEDTLGYYVPEGINLINSQKKGGKK